MMKDFTRLLALIALFIAAAAAVSKGQVSNTGRLLITAITLTAWDMNIWGTY